jgi:hypothetical protein
MVGLVSDTLQSTNLIDVGWREWLALPELGIPAIKAKIDTGARTSALHAFELVTFESEGSRRVRFQLHPIRHRPDIVVAAEAEVVDERVVTSSSGTQEQRVVIRTPLSVGESSWPIELTLTNRETMRFRMLLGRTAMQGRVVVDPSASFLCGRRGERAIARLYDVRPSSTRLGRSR